MEINNKGMDRLTVILKQDLRKMKKCWVEVYAKRQIIKIKKKLKNRYKMQIQKTCKDKNKKSN